MAKTKTYTAEVTASNSHNWLLRYTIDAEELAHTYNGDIQAWLDDISRNGCEPMETIDEEHGGTILPDGEAYLVDTEE